MTIYNIIMRKYNILNGSNVIGTFETEYNLDTNEWLQNVLEQVFDGATSYSEIVIEQPKPRSGVHTFYVYRYEGLGCQKVVSLGQIETHLSLYDIWDIMFQIFCSDGRGMFVRKEPIYE